jgi:hypothetical protein
MEGLTSATGAVGGVSAMARVAESLVHRKSGKKDREWSEMAAAGVGAVEVEEKGKRKPPHT